MKRRWCVGNGVRASRRRQPQPIRGETYMYIIYVFRWRRSLHRIIPADLYACSLYYVSVLPYVRSVQAGSAFVGWCRCRLTHRNIQQFAIIDTLHSPEWLFSVAQTQIFNFIWGPSALRWNSIRGDWIFLEYLLSIRLMFHADLDWISDGRLCTCTSATIVNMGRTMGVSVNFMTCEFNEWRSNLPVWVQMTS